MKFKITPALQPMSPSVVFSLMARKYYLLATFTFCAVLGFVFSSNDDSLITIGNMIVFLCGGFTIHFSIALLLPYIKKYHVYLQWLAVTLTLALATPLGLYIGLALVLDLEAANQGITSPDIFFIIPFGLGLGGLFIGFFYSRANINQRNTTKLKLQLENTAKEKQLAQAQLKLLQAQIEPHFLFNTLANVHSLIHEQSDLATSLLEKTNDYLRAALNHSRSKSCLLSDETSLLQAYLEIMKVRMGGRLDFAIIVANSAAKLPFPPMLLQPLVENAIKHGLEPKVEGGSIQVLGMVKDKKLCLDVIDTGIGFENFKSEGVGLSNVRERLQKLYGDNAEFHISALGNRGVISSIQIPVELL